MRASPRVLGLRKLSERLLLAVTLGAATGCSAARYQDGFYLLDRTRAVPQEMPELHWPPPAWTTFRELRFELPPQSRLGDYCREVQKIIEPAGLSDASILAIGEDGFAVMTRMEQIDAEGNALDAGRRFAIDDAGQVGRPRTLSEYFDVLFNLKPGRFRVFLVAVTARVVTRDVATGGGWKQVRTIYQSGATHLPAELADRLVSQNTRVTLLVYEFERPSRSERPRLVLGSQLTAARHAAGAGLSVPR
jgi:hypothetical protein